jgi:aminopeptidase N
LLASQGIPSPEFTWRAGWRVGYLPPYTNGGLMFLLLTPLLALAAPPAPIDLQELVDPATHRMQRFHAPRGEALMAGAAEGVPGMGWDIQSYRFTLRFDTERRTVEGQVDIDALRTTGEDFILHAKGPEITSLTVDGEDQTWTVDGDELHLGALEGDAVQVSVSWTAFPSEGTGGLQWGEEVIFSFHEPSFARRWLVVYDDPSDKASLEWLITAPEDLVVAANGELVGTTTENGESTWNFVLDGPIPTYLMAVHLSDYVLLESGEDIPIYTWAYPGSEEAAQDTFGSTADMLSYFAELYGPYPWQSYGNAMAPFAGAMEHTTVTTFSEDLVGDEWGEQVNAHELGHHWWGDDVTLGTWDDIWLNEGFASYTEVLWYEQYYGDAGRVTYAGYQLDSYLAWQVLESGSTLYAPNFMWGGVVYDKGSLVLHTLRGVLGDEVFFEALRAYEAEFRHSNAVTTDLISSLSATTGQDLGWFFDSWVYSAPDPVYSYGLVSEEIEPGIWQADLVVTQEPPDFTMPLQVELLLSDGSVIEERIWVDGAGSSLRFCLSQGVQGLTMDPGFWVPLATFEEVAVASLAPTCGELEQRSAGCSCRTSPVGFGLQGLVYLVFATLVWGLRGSRVVRETV